MDLDGTGGGEGYSQMVPIATAPGSGHAATYQDLQAAPYIIWPLQTDCQPVATTFASPGQIQWYTSAVPQPTEHCSQFTNAPTVNQQQPISQPQPENPPAFTFTQPASIIPGVISASNLNVSASPIIPSDHVLPIITSVTSLAQPNNDEHAISASHHASDGSVNQQKENQPQTLEECKTDQERKRYRNRLASRRCRAKFRNQLEHFRTVAAAKTEENNRLRVLIRQMCPTLDVESIVPSTSAGYHEPLNHLTH
ncbi:ORF43 [callitrichine gammaherpesvirus 3]|uniref:ORF43 n=1 Tax=callitrichine gammaherpesvirus 3 TaxID=106331 RepID=Q993G7_9GAMA|nr:ORF43 [callitrichine gammaherpesvirus 3]AAK38251.1 ORF43 [callitrichine gammaherpesvirus 3]